VHKWRGRILRRKCTILSGSAVFGVYEPVFVPLGLVSLSETLNEVSLYTNWNFGKTVVMIVSTT